MLNWTVFACLQTNNTLLYGLARASEAQVQYFHKLYTSYINGLSQNLLPYSIDFDAGTNEKIALKTIFKLISLSLPLSNRSNGIKM